jgi:hypothetical protein
LVAAPGWEGFAAGRVRNELELGRELQGLLKNSIPARHGASPSRSDCVGAASLGRANLPWRGEVPTAKRVGDEAGR